MTNTNITSDVIDAYLVARAKAAIRIAEAIDAGRPVELFDQVAFAAFNTAYADAGEARYAELEAALDGGPA